MEFKKVDSSPDCTSKAHVISGLPIRSTSIEKGRQTILASIRGEPPPGSIVDSIPNFRILGSPYMCRPCFAAGLVEMGVKKEKQFNSRVASKRVQLITITRVRTAKSLKRDNTTKRSASRLFQNTGQRKRVSLRAIPITTYVKQCRQRLFRGSFPASKSINSKHDPAFVWRCCLVRQVRIVMFKPMSRCEAQAAGHLHLRGVCGLLG